MDDIPEDLKQPALVRQGSSEEMMQAMMTIGESLSCSSPVEDIHGVEDDTSSAAVVVMPAAPPSPNGEIEDDASCSERQAAATSIQKLESITDDWIIESITDEWKLESTSIILPKSLALILKENIYFLRGHLGVYSAAIHSIGCGGEYYLRLIAEKPFQLKVAIARVQKLIDDKGALQEFQSVLPARPEEEIHVFVDVSNLCLSAQMEMDGHSIRRNRNIRIDTDQVALLLKSGRKVVQSFAFGENTGVWDAWRWRRCGYEVYERHGGDEAFLQTLKDKLEDAVMSATATRIVGGTGQRVMVFVGGADFLEACEDALSHGLKVEVWAWKEDCSRRYKDLEKAHACEGNFKLVFFDDELDKVTIDEGARPSRDELGFKKAFKEMCRGDMRKRDFFASLASRFAKKISCA